MCTDEEFEWDDIKCEANIAKHGIDFTDAAAIFDGGIWETPSFKSDEERVMAVGYCEGNLLTVIYTWRGRKRRIISARRAKRNEQRQYHLHEPQRGSPPEE